MYSIVVLCAVLGGIFADTEIYRLPSTLVDKIQPQVNKCMEETNAPPDAFSKMLMGLIEDDASLKFSQCYMAGTKYITSDGLFNVNAVTVLLKDHPAKEQFAKALEDCNNNAVGKDLELLRAMADCFHRNSPLYLAL